MEREFRELIERKVEERLAERHEELQDDLRSAKLRMQVMERERDRAIVLLVGLGVVPALRVNIANAKPIFSVINWKGEEMSTCEDANEAIQLLLEEKQKAVEAGMSKTNEFRLTTTY